MKNSGITLIELMVVISIIAILAIALGFSFVGWQGRYKVERTTKELYTDLMDARARAVTRNRAYFADFLSGITYRIIEDTNDNGAIDGGDAATPKSVEYTMTIGTTGVEPPITFNFDKRGISSPERTICMFTTVDPDYDCIVISQTRMNMGKIINQANQCNAANCNAK
ncbi:MAG: GspH/FimT family protein [Nitrospirota bacterium]